MAFLKKLFGLKQSKKDSLGDVITKPAIPSHVAIIMDGNGRWAERLGKPRSYGHKFGAENVDGVVSHAFKRGVKVVSLYAFSSENWARPKDEVQKIFSLIVSFFKKYVDKANEYGIKIVFSGDLDGLPKDLKKQADSVLQSTCENKNGVLNIALNYGARAEIARAATLAVQNGEPVTPETLPKYLYTAELGDPELIIRTSGEYRLSNFMLFQSAYAELYFTDVLWPDFDEAEFDKAIEDFSKRKRRYGGLNEK